MNGSWESLSMLKRNLQHTKTDKKTTSSSYWWPRRLNFCNYFCQYFDLEQILGFFHYISVFDHKWKSCMISKACYKPHTIFFSLPVKDCLIYKLLVAVYCHSEKRIYVNNSFVKWKFPFTLRIFSKVWVLVQADKKIGQMGYIIWSIIA